MFTDCFVRLPHFSVGVDVFIASVTMASVKKKTPNHLKSLHERDQEKRLVVILEQSSLETVKLSVFISIKDNKKTHRSSKKGINTSKFACKC